MAVGALYFWVDTIPGGGFYLEGLFGGFKGVNDHLSCLGQGPDPGPGGPLEDPQGSSPGWRSLEAEDFTAEQGIN